MTKDYHTLRVWTSTVRRLRLIAVLRNQNLVTTVDNLVNEELRRLGAEDLLERETEDENEQEAHP